MTAPETLPNKKPQRSLRFYWTLSIVLVSAALAFLFTALLVQYRITDLIAASDARLLTAAEMAREIVGADFHDAITGPDSVSQEEFEQIVARNDDLCRRLQLQYLWSVLQVDDDLVFTTATHTDINDPSSPAASFFEIHRDPDSFSGSLKAEGQPVFSSFENEWGRGRQVLIAYKDALGRNYIFGASIQTEAYSALFWQTAVKTLVLGGLVLLGLFLPGLALARRLTDPILKLTESATRMASGDFETAMPGGNTREVQSLADSFERLRQNIQKRIRDLRIIEPRLALALRAGGVAIWDYDIASGELIWDDTMFRLYGIPRKEFDGTYACWQSLLHPEDLKRSSSEVEQALRGEKEFDTEFRVVWPDDSIHYLRGLAQVERDVGGNPLRMTGTNWDITEQKSAELQARQDHEELLAIFAGFNESVYVSDPDTYELVYANHTLEAQFGPPENRKCYQYLQNRDQPCPFCTNEKIFGEQSGRPYQWDYFNEAIQHWYECMDRTIPWPDGRSLRLQIAVDVTNRKIAEQELNDKLLQIERINDALNKSEQKYRLLFENMTAGFALHEMIYDENGDPVDYRYLEVNPAFERLTGARAQDLVGRTVREVMPNTEQYWIDTYGRVASSGEPVSYKNFSSELGRTFEVWAFSPAPGRFATVFSDVSDREKAEESLRKSEWRLASAIAGTGAGLWDWDMVTDTVYFSPQWKSMLGYEDHEVENNFSGWKKLWHPEDAARIEKAVSDFFEGRTRNYEIVHRLQHKDGRWRWILTRGDIHKDAAGKPSRWIGTNIDITERKRAEEMIDRVNNQLQEKNRELEQMVYAASHDLRSPLVNIDGYSRELRFVINDLEDTLKEFDLPNQLTNTVFTSLQEMRGDLHYILSSTAQMEGLLAGLLKLSRSGRTVLNITNLDMSRLVTQVVAAVEYQVMESGISVNLSPLPECQGDSVAVSQIFANLISNAIKFRRPEKPGVLRISGKVEGNLAVYCVEDEGIGIAPAHQEKIFGLFQRLDPEKYPGDGLGLTIVRQTLHRLGGSVRVESEPESGSRFYVSLPRDASGIQDQ